MDWTRIKLGPIGLAEEQRAMGSIPDAVARADWSAPCVGQHRPETHARPAGRTQGGALVHVLEELVQHRGQLEVTADVLRHRLVLSYDALADGVPVPVECPADTGFKLQPRDLEKAITPKTKWLILNSPSNPTGRVLPVPHLRKVVAWARERGESQQRLEMEVVEELPGQPRGVDDQDQLARHRQARPRDHRMPCQERARRPDHQLFRPVDRIDLAARDCPRRSSTAVAVSQRPPRARGPRRCRG